MDEHQPSPKPIDLSLDNIQINQPQKYQHKSLLQENKFIRKQNQVLKRELEKISSRLDVEIKKRIDQGKKKNYVKTQDISQMELQNAYKKCQIYKKQAQMYKKKLETYEDQGRTDDFQRRISSYARDNLELKEQIKQLRKISKFQQKGLTEMGLDGYSKVSAENEKLKQEVRILKKEVDNYRRALQGSKHKRAAHSQFQERPTEYQQERKSSAKKDSRVQSKIKRKLKTQQSMTETNQQLNDLLQQKVEKDYMKIKTLANQKNKLRELVDNLKLQLGQKQKQNSMLKQKISDLRKNNQLLQSQAMANKSQAELSDNKNKKQSNSNYPKGIKSNKLFKGRQPKSQQKKRVWKKQQSVQQEIQTEQMPNEDSQPSSFPQSSANQPNNLTSSIKWSHQHLSSKIKQLQMLKHEQGHIKDIHVRYEKGQPKKYDQSNSKHKYQIFVCSQDQFIKYIEGAFYHGYLQYIIITSNHRRVEKYGNYQQFQHNEQAEHFSFQVKDKEYPGGLFGQTNEVGVRKLGCFIHKQN